jgi:pheromone shutdown protein TraB
MPRKDNPMTDLDSRTRAAGGSGAIVLARVTVATLLVLAAPAVSFLLTTGIAGSGTSIRFPAGYPVMLIVTVLVTVAASALGARIAGRAGFTAIRFVLAWWAVISFAVTVAGVSLGRAHLTELGIAILAAALAGIAAGLPLAARR